MIRETAWNKTRSSCDTCSPERINATWVYPSHQAVIQAKSNSVIHLQSLPPVSAKIFIPITRSTINPFKRQ
jgi:hypothetical protein